MPRSQLLCPENSPMLLGHLPNCLGDAENICLSRAEYIWSTSCYVHCPFKTCRDCGLRSSKEQVEVNDRAPQSKVTGIHSSH